MPDLTFTTPEGQTIDRELLIAYLNTGSSESPVWSAIGKRVEDSSEEMDWGQESKQDVLGNTFTTMKKPVITQTFDPIPLDAGDAAAVKMWNLAVKDHDAQALANQDMMIGHFYATSGDAKFAERYDSCAIAITSIGGEGGVIPANREFLAVLGDQKRGTNIEAPADLIRQIVREEVGQASGSTHVTIVLDSVDGKKLFDAIVKENNSVIRATGASPLKV